MSSKQNNDQLRTSRILMCFHLVFLVLSVIIIGKIFVTQVFWKPNEKYVTYFTPQKLKARIEPERGDIIDRNGKLLAMSTPVYDIYMDCTVRKASFQNDTTKVNGRTKEDVWLAKSDTLSEELAAFFQEKGKSASWYSNLIRDGRLNNRKYVSIIRSIDHDQMLAVKKMHLFREGKFKGGLIIQKHDTRQYPYGDLAGRTIGYVKNNSDSSTRHIGIEGKYNHILHGKAGIEWKRRSERKSSFVKDSDSSVIAVQHGLDIRSTIDIDLQDMADKALRKHSENDENIAGGCVVLMEVETGAIRSMVNLQKDRHGKFREIYMVATSRSSEPGSIFKTVTMTSLLEDGKVSLEQKIPTNHGKMDDMPKIKPDEYIVKWEKKHHTDRISVIDGFKISSNYVFRRLVKDTYSEQPREFIDRFHTYGFGNSRNFELREPEAPSPKIPDVGAESWSDYDLVSTAIGYNVTVTPMQVATFYNAIANDGKMMKPFIVSQTEMNGQAVEVFEPEILNGSICSKATADTLTRALKLVTEEGTGAALKGAKFQVAGKTGTSRIFLETSERPGSKDPYMDIEGRKKHQATFVGFFPADEPKYTAIVMVYTDLMKGNVYGGSIPAATFRDIVDGIWANETEWSRELTSRARVPEMREDNISIAAKKKGGHVPDVEGMGIKDALYCLENNGFRCRYSGIGHVARQIPAAGTELKKGQIIELILK